MIPTWRVELLSESLSQTNGFPILTCEVGSSVCYKAVPGFKKIIVNGQKHKEL